MTFDSLSLYQQLDAPSKRILHIIGTPHMQDCCSEGPTALTLLPETAAICSTNFLVIFQKRCWSPSSANRLPEDGSHRPDNRISTCETQVFYPRSAYSVHLGCAHKYHRLLQQSASGNSAATHTRHLFAPSEIAECVAVAACSKAWENESGSACKTQ